MTTPSLPSAVDAALESGPYIRRPGQPWAFLDAVRGNCPPSAIEDPRKGCLRWPEQLWLVNRSTGELVQGRCKATNRCSYCRREYLRETADVLRLDSAISPPTVYVVLTAREFLARADCRRHLEHVARALRRRWPGAQWFVSCELQGRGALHLNLLLKGPLASESAFVWSVVARAWVDRVDAEHVAQHAEPIYDAARVEEYVGKVASYVAKTDQQPGEGWTAHRTSQTRQYFHRSIVDLRREVRARRQRSMYLGMGLDRGLAGLALRSYVTNQFAISRLDGWELRVVRDSDSASAPQRRARKPVPARAERGANERPPSAVKGYVDDQSERLFDVAHLYVAARNRGPHTERS